MSTPSGVNLRGVWGSAPDDAFAVGAQGTILRFDGLAWKGMASGTSAYLTAVWGNGPSDVFAVGAQGTILRYDGASFSPMTSGTDRLLADVWGRGPSEVFAIGSDVILRYDGASWQESRVDLRMVGSSRCPGPGRIGPPDGYVVGSHGLVLRHCAQGQCP